jgi:transposase
VVIAPGIQRLRRELPEVLAAETLPPLVRDVVAELRARLGELDRRLTESDRRLEHLAKQNEAATRLMQVEGVGPLTAIAMVATMGDGHAFQHGRQFAAWLGLGPKQHCTGGKPRLGRITKHGNVELRTLLIHGARAVLQLSANRRDRKSRWVEAVRGRRGGNIAAVALAAKHARILWALLAHGQDYQAGGLRALHYIERTVPTMNENEELTTGCEESDVMETGTDRHSGHPLTPQVQNETAERMAPECTHDPQGQSKLAHQQAE